MKETDVRKKTPLRRGLALGAGEERGSKGGAL